MTKLKVLLGVADTDNWIVAGMRWRWGDGYNTLEAAALALRNTGKVAYGFTRCAVCREFVHGLREYPHTCAKCGRKVDAEKDTQSGAKGAV